MFHCFGYFYAQEHPPHIPFVSKVKKMEKVDEPDVDKSEWIKLEFLIDPENPASKYSVQQFVQRLNDLNHYLLYFPEENPKQLDQDEIIEIFDQAKAPEWHEALVNANIDIFEMSYEECALISRA
jgi:hypothetical protein